MEIVSVLEDQSSDEFETRLRKVKPTITGLVSYWFQEEPDKIDDFVQIAMIGAWDQLKEDPSLSDTCLVRKAKDRISEEQQRRRRLKRGGSIRNASLDEEQNEDGATLMDYISAREDLLPMEKVEVVKKYLRKRFGGDEFKFLKRHRGMPVYKAILGQIGKFLVEEVGGFEVNDDLPRKINVKFFRNHSMIYYFMSFYNKSPIRFLEDAYPGRFHTWQFTRPISGYWTEEQGYEHALEAIDWFCEKYKITGEEHKLHAGFKEFNKEHLVTMLEIYFEGSAYKALKTKFLNLKPWQMRANPDGFFTSPEYGDKNTYDALNWIYTRFGTTQSRNGNKSPVGQREFRAVGLTGMLKGSFRNNISRAYEFYQEYENRNGKAEIDEEDQARQRHQIEQFSLVEAA